jgi:hypothetical protein
MALASTLALTVLAGCDKQDDVTNEAYKGVPHNGQSCKEAYKLPANQVKCTQAEGRH